MKQITCIIPAAGLSSRMGDFKPLMDLNGIPMIERTVNSMLSAGVSKCIIVLGYRGEEIEALLKNNTNIEFIYNKKYNETDMLYSIKLGIKYLINSVSSISGSLILPADMPMVSSYTISHLIDHFLNNSFDVVFPTYNFKKKHPPIISKNCFKYIVDFNQDGGLKQALKKFENNTNYLEINDVGCCLDADTKLEFSNLKEFINQGYIKTSKINNKHLI